MHDQVPTGLTLDESSRTGYQGFLLAVQLMKTKSHSHTREGSEITPRVILPEPPGGYTRWVRSRAPFGKPKYPLGDSIRITRELGGYTHQVHSRAPSSESKYLSGDSI